MKKTLLRGGTIVGVETPRWGVSKDVTSDVLIGLNGEIESIRPSIQDHKDTDVIDVTGKFLFPLLIDCHVHFREPGMEHKATMASEAAAALAGGVGTVCEMPNTIPPTVTIAALADKVRRAEKIAGCSLKFFFGVTEAIHLVTLKDLWTGTSLELKRLKNHCCGVKLYLDHSTGDQKVDGGIVEEIFRTCAELGIPLVAHCEDPKVNAKAKSEVETPRGGVSANSVALHSAMRPPESEAASIEYAIGMVRKTGAAFHIAHLSTKQGIDLVRAAKKEKLPVTCEVSPHHLFLTTDDYASLGTFGKMNPPLRSAEHRDALWAGIMDGTVDCIATDHAPHTIDEKKSTEPLKAPSGVPGVETVLPLLLTAAAGKWPNENSKNQKPKTKLSYGDIVRLCFTNPNRIFSLGAPGLAEKNSAKIIIVDPTEEWLIEAKNLHSKCGWTPFEGWQVTGKIGQVIVR